MLISDEQLAALRDEEKKNQTEAAGKGDRSTKYPKDYQRQLDALNEEQRMAYRNKVEILRNTTSIVSVLAALGYSTESPKKDFYFSPLHEERTPSFHINEKEHYWCDFGLDGYGHSVFDLVLLCKPEFNNSFSKAVEFLSNLNPAAAQSVSVPVSVRKEKSTEKRIEVTKVVQPIWGKALRSYAIDERCISAAVLDKYCSQVNYKTEYIDQDTGDIRSRQYFSIGFPNRSKGWALRNKFTKSSTGSGVTLVHSDGSFDDSVAVTPSANRLVIFEGFFDFLSWLELNHQVVPEGKNVLVLNSVVNVDRAVSIISLYPEVWGYLDNDKAGQNTTDTIEEIVKKAGHVFTDRRSMFKECNDVNECWMNICRQKKQAAPAPTPAPSEEFTPDESFGPVDASKGMRP